MNLVLLGYVAWKHRLVLLVGFGLACLLAFVAVYRVGSNGISYRQQEQWVSHETLLVTQPGFPVGRTVLNTGQNSAPGAPTTGTGVRRPRSSCGACDAIRADRDERRGPPANADPGADPWRTAGRCTAGL